MWDGLVETLGKERPVITMDLPGHGSSLDYPQIGAAGLAAKAVIATLDDLDLSRVHLAGHSMGGATAALLGMMIPDRVATLSLLAPGGFGPEINHKLLRRYAEADNPAEIGFLLEQFFGFENGLKDGEAERIWHFRQNPAAQEALVTILDDFMDGLIQKTLPVKRLADLPMPIKIIWGTQDRVLPTRQSHKMPGTIGTHVFERTGHMLPLERPDDMAYLIAQNCACA